MLKALPLALAHVGLRLNVSKCQLWGPGVHVEGEAPPTLPDGLEGIPVVPYGPSAGVTVLGVPVDAPGGRECLRDAWSKAVTKTEKVLERLQRLPDGQIQHCVLRYCLDACKVNHLMRAARHDGAETECHRLSVAIKHKAERVVGTTLDPRAWEQATLPISVGGLGVRDPKKIWPVARIAALVGFHIMGPTTVGTPAAFLSHTTSDWDATVARLQHDLGPVHEPTAHWASEPANLQSADPTYARQAWWAAEVKRARRAQLPAIGSVRGATRLEN